MAPSHSKDSENEVLSDGWVLFPLPLKAVDAAYAVKQISTTKPKGCSEQRVCYLSNGGSRNPV